MKTKNFLIMVTLAVSTAITSVMTSCSKEDSQYINSSLHVTDPDGTLEVSETRIILPSDGKPMKLIATYKSSKGLYDPTAITVYDEDGNKVLGVQDGDNMIFDIVREGTYTVSAGNLSLKVIAISEGTN